MASISYVSGKEKYRDANAIPDVLNYILNPKKVIGGYAGGFYVDMAHPAEDMLEVRREYDKQLGTQLRHFVISFSPTELTDPRAADRVAQDVVRYIGQYYQTVYAVHEDKLHIHIHLVINTVSYVDGSRYDGSREFFHAFMEDLYHIFRKHKLSIWYAPVGGKVHG